MRKKSQAIDALTPFAFTIEQRHVDEAKPFSNTCCANALAIKAAGAQDVRFNRNVVQVKRRGQWYRYMAGAAAKLIAALIDKGNRKRIILPRGGVRVVINPPKGVRSLAYLRSDARKRIEKASKERNKGKVRRTYRRTDGVSLEDIRHGRGAWV